MRRRGECGKLDRPQQIIGIPWRHTSSTSPVRGIERRGISIIEARGGRWGTAPHLPCRRPRPGRGPWAWPYPRSHLTLERHGLAFRVEQVGVRPGDRECRDLGDLPSGAFGDCRGRSSSTWALASAASAGGRVPLTLGNRPSAWTCRDLNRSRQKEAARVPCDNRSFT
jgi:hypothetical protein